MFCTFLYFNAFIWSSQQKCLKSGEYFSLHTDHICASTDINFPSVPLPTFNSDVVLLFRSSINFKAILFKNIGWALTLLGTPSTDIARYGPAPPLAAMAPQSNHSLAICWTKTAQRAPWQPPYQIQLLSPSFLLVLIFQGDPCLCGCLHWTENEMCDCVWWTESHLLFMVFCLTSTQALCTYVSSFCCPVLGGPQ